MKLLNFGSCNIDYVYQLDHIVLAGETQSSLNVQVFAGGKGLNQSISVSRAGSEVYHAGAIGKDGKFLSNLLKENGVNVDYLKTVEEKTGHAIIQVAKSSENSIFIHSGANASIDKKYIDLVLSNFSKGDFLLLQNEISNVDYIIDKAFEKEMIIILNPSPINDKINKIDLNKISYLILNQTEAQAITGHKEEASALEYFKNNYPELKVVLTLGKSGSVYQDKKQKYYQASYKVKPIDTTAAGDTFTGYFVSGLIKGNPLRSVMSYASLASAIAVSRNGAAPSIPLLLEVEKSVSTITLQEENLEEKSIKQTIEYYIEKNLATASVKELAVKLGYSIVYTGFMVKKLFGVTYKELLMEKRLNKALELLTASDLSISEIISVVGYENQGYFRKKFIEKYGKKPLQFRNKYR